MQYDFSTVDEAESFVAVDPGVYRCRIAEVRDGRSRTDGSVQWSLRLEVTEGEFAGRTAAWDRLTWSEKGIRRVKAVLAAFGVDVNGVVEIEPTDLHGREAVAQVVIEEYPHAVTGRSVKRTAVPYSGYGPVGGELPPSARSGATNGAGPGEGDLSSFLDDWQPVGQGAS